MRKIKHDLCLLTSAFLLSFSDIAKALNAMCYSQYVSLGGLTFLTILCECKMNLC